MEKMVGQLEQALLATDRQGAWDIVETVLQASDAVSCVESVMAPALERIGEAWETGTASLSQVYMSGRICEAFMEELLPLETRGSRPEPNMALAVLEDYHMLGKRLVAFVLRANRLDFMDYGRVQTIDLVRQVERDRIEILLISTLMLPSALQIKEVARLLAERGLDVKIIAGGAPFRFDRALFREVGADAAAERASEVVAMIRQVSGERL